MNRDPQAGFTLLEVLIAFAIAGLALAALAQGVVAGLAATQGATRIEEALVRARSRLAAIDGGTLRPGERRGEDGGGFAWRERVSPLASAALPAAEGFPGAVAATPPARVALFAVTVEVAWQQGGRQRSVVLESRRLGPAGPARP